MLAGIAILSSWLNLLASDQPQWGSAWSRNLVSKESGLPSNFDPKTRLNHRWSASLGTESYGSPIISKGRVYIGTNNNNPRDPRHQGDRGVLLCLDEKTGELIWQLVCPKREEDPYHDWPKSGLCSPPTIEKNRIYIVNNRGEVLCMDPDGMANGNDGPVQDEGVRMVPKGAAPLTPGKLDADILWSFNLTTEAGIWSHDNAHSSIIVNGDHLYLNSGTGVDNTHRKIRTPDAPSLVVLDKKTGRLLAREREGIAPNIFHCTWSAPALGKIQGKETVVFAGGNGIVYGFEALKKSPPSGEVQTLKKLWWYDPDPDAPKENVHRFTTNKQEGPSNIYGMPVLDGNRIYVAGGGDIFWGKNEAWLQCFEVTEAGDLTVKGRVWSYPLTKHTLSTPVLHGGLVYVTDCGRLIHCVDARTGKGLWTHEAKGDFWGSPMVADGKVYAGSRRGDLLILKAGAVKELLSTVDLKYPISATPTAANGTLFISTMMDIHAFSEGGR